MSRFTLLQRRLAAIGLALLAVPGCERLKSANPLSPDVAGPIPGVQITAPKTLEPPNNALIDNRSQPVQLLIENAGTSGQRPLFLQLELAADVNFQQILHQADRLPPGDNGRTTYRMPSPLAAGHTYFWRVRAADGANTGPYSAAASFHVLEPVVLETPTPLEPTGTTTTNRPVFRVRNGSVSGPAEGVVYRVELADRPDPAAISSTATVTPGSDGTTTFSMGDLAWNTTYYWRVFSMTGDGSVRSAYSMPASFRTPPAPAPTPSPTPSPTPIPPTAPGTRTPDPPPGQRLPLPNMSHVVQQVAAQYPAALRNSCQDHGGTWEFMDRLVDTLRTYDTRWGYNWKRGNVGDPSLDVVAYHFGSGPDEGSIDVYIIDVIGGHCGPSPAPSWNDVTEATRLGGSIGRWTGRGRF
ncbi:MAG: hypothetical protein AB1635_02355 [Acidobacteriota bacterium]